MSLTDTRSWSKRSGTVVGTALVTRSTSSETAAAGPGARIVALIVVTPLNVAYIDLPGDFDRWDLAGSRGQTVTHVVAEHGHLTPDFPDWYLVD